ncbi:MAG: transposase [Alphaproteobacteria bacterium]|nr:transposase [Alphaproteobacteria bacterium]
MEAIASDLQNQQPLHKGMLPTKKVWWDKELLGCKFKDALLSKRFRTLIKHLSDGFEKSIPLVRQD